MTELEKMTEAFEAQLMTTARALADLNTARAQHVCDCEDLEVAQMPMSWALVVETALVDSPAKRSVSLYASTTSTAVVLGMLSIASNQLMGAGS